MEEIINRVLEFLLPRNDIFLYLFLFASAVVENLFPPIPGDTITAFGAFLVGIGRLNYFLVFASTTAGSVLGFMALFFLGRFLEREFFMKKNFRFFSKENIIRGEAWFQKYGCGIVLANRFLPGLRSVISIISGISKLHPVKVCLLSLASASVWNLIWLQTGFLLGNNWDTVKEKVADIVSKYNIAVGIFIILLVLAYVAFTVIRKRMRKNDG